MASRFTLVTNQPANVGSAIHLFIDLNFEIASVIFAREFPHDGRHGSKQLGSSLRPSRLVRDLTNASLFISHLE